MGMSSAFIRISQKELDSFLQDSSLLAKRVYQEEEDPNCIDLDKNWDGIIFLLTGGPIAHSHDHDLARIFFSGNLVDQEQDLGYGPAHFLSPSEVKSYYSKLLAFSHEDLKNNFFSCKNGRNGCIPFWNLAKRK